MRCSFLRFRSLRKAPFCVACLDCAGALTLCLSRKEIDRNQRHSRSQQSSRHGDVQEGLPSSSHRRHGVWEDVVLTGEERKAPQRERGREKEAADHVQRCPDSPQKTLFSRTRFFQKQSLYPSTPLETFHSEEKEQRPENSFFCDPGS